jgi:hypothetical protein
MGKYFPNQKVPLAFQAGKYFLVASADERSQLCTLRLTGRAGGTWTWGSSGPVVELDAIEFCRTISGRAHGDGLLSQQVPF